MSIPRIDLLLKDSRIASLSKDYGEEYGIQDDFFIVALNKAHNIIQRYLVTEMAEPFAAYKDYTAVVDTLSYALPTDIFSTNLVYDVRFSPTGLERDLSDPLDRMHYREYGSSGSPYKWMVDGGYLYLDQAPNASGGLIRIRYERRLNKLDVRRGQVSNVGGVITLSVLEVDTTTDDEEAFATAEYLSTVDNFGTVTCRNIQVSGYNSSTGAFTVVPKTLETGEAISTGNWVLLGNSSSTHFQLPDCFEDYYIDFCKNEVYELLSEDEQSVSNPKLDRILAKCTEIYAQLPSGRTPIPEERKYY